MPLEPIGFWSYTRADDESAIGHLSQWRQELARRLRATLGRPVTIHQDIETIALGQAWEAAIDRALAESAFLIPIVTPAFLRSKWCCEEVKRFRRIMEQRNRKDMILPLHCIDVSAFAKDRPRRAECHDPDVYDYLRTLNWHDLRHLKLFDASHIEVRQQLDKVASAIQDTLYRPVPAPRGQAAAQPRQTLMLGAQGVLPLTKPDFFAAVYAVP
jgi:hypothetical protein